MRPLRGTCLVAASLVASAIFTQPVSSQTPPTVPKKGYAVEGRPGLPGSGFVLHEKLTAVSWEPFESPGLPPGLQRRLLSESPSMGAVSQITYVPAGWSRPAGYHNVDDEIFVLEGDLSIGDEKLTRYSYSFMPAGKMHGPVKSRQGAVLLEWWKGKPDFVASSRDKKGARDYAQVRDWNLYKKSWYIDKPFPDYRPGGNFPGAVHNMLREDPDTLEMTWMTFGASIPAPSSGGVGNFGGGYEVHPSFEEYFYPEKSFDSYINECLEQGETTVKYGDRTYWWRPGGIGHGGRPSVSPGEPKAGYSISIVRTGVRLWADYVTDCTYKTGLEKTDAGWKTYPYDRHAHEED